MIHSTPSSRDRGRSLRPVWARAALLVVVLLAGTPVLGAEAAPKPPSLELVPNHIAANALSAEEPVNVQVHLTAGSQPLSRVTLSIFSNDGIEVRDPRAATPLEKLAPESEYSWSLQLVRKGGLLSQAKVQARVEFDIGESPAIHRFLYGEAEISPRATANGAGVVSADFIGGTTTLAHERPAQVLFRLANQYPHPLDITSIHAYKPLFVGVARKSTDDAGTSQADAELSVENLGEIASGQAKVIPLTVSATSEVVPGKYTVMLSARLTGKDGSSHAVVASREVEVFVLGESDVLKDGGHG